MKTPDEDPLEVLGQEGRDQDPPEDPRWEALAMGTLTDEEAEALRVEAEGSEEGRRKYELFRPFDAEATEASFDRLQAKLLEDAALPRAAEARPAPPAPAAPVARPWRARRPVIFAALALAAAVALWLSRRDPPPRVASFQLTISGEKEQRGEPLGPSTTLRLTDSGSHGRLTLTPTERLDDPLRVRILLLQDGVLRNDQPCVPTLDLSTNKVEIDCPREKMVSGSPPGKWMLFIAAGRSEAMRLDDAQLIAEPEQPDGRPSPKGFQVFRVPVDFVGPHGAKDLPFEVEHAGCGSLRSEGSDTLCEIPSNRTIQLWIKAPSGAVVTRTLDGTPLQSPGKAVQGGELFLVEAIPDGARLLVVEASQYGISRSARLKLAPRRAHPDLDKAASLRKDPKTCPEARDLVTPLLKDPDPGIGALAMGTLARIEKKLGELDAAVGHFQEALLLDRSAGLLSVEADDRLAFSFTLSQNRPGQSPRFNEARRVLADMEPLLDRYPEGRALRPYYLGIIDVDTGDLRAALRRFREADRATERLGLEKERSEARRTLAGALAILGRRAEALAIFRDLERARVFGADSCAEEQFFNDFGWFILSSVDPTGSPAIDMPDPVPLLETSLRLFRLNCKGSSDIHHVLANLALAELVKGDVTKARSRLDEARKEEPRPDVRVKASWAFVEAQIALRSSQPKEALAAYEQLATLAREASLPAYQAKAALGRAQALDALGQTGDARDAYAEADAILDARSLAVPIGEGKEGFVARNEQSARFRVDFLLRQADAAQDQRASLLAEAGNAARRSRARILTTFASIERLDSLPPAKRRDWEAAMDAYRSQRAAFDAAEGSAKDPRAVEAKLDEALALAGLQGAAEASPLPGPAKGEVILVYHPVLDGWAGFAITERGISAVRLGAIDLSAPNDRLASQLLAPFQAALDGATRLRLAPSGALATLDFQALPWKGKPLIASFPVVYGVDLPRRLREPGLAGAPFYALVVDDPEEDLPRAREEASDVAAALTQAGARVTRLSGRQATRAAVLAALLGIDLLHYSGHGHFEGRDDGLGSSLTLAGHAQLTAGDILALPGVPRQVILSGCETARTVEGPLSQGLGLGQAFVAAGAESVVAATRRVDDSLAKRLMASLVKHAAKRPDDLASALREAQLEVAAELPASDWATFRLLVP